MVKSLDQLEKNVAVSFSYVKKDLLMANDSISDLHDKIQHLSLNQAMLLEKISNVEKMLAKPKAKKPKAKKKKSKTVKQETTSKKVKSRKSVKKSKTPKKIIKETVLYE